MNKELWLPDSEINSLLSPNLDFTDESFGMIAGDGGQQASIHRLAELSAMLDKMEEMKKYSGMSKWFVPGTPFGIEHCPKHAAFFAAGDMYGERLLMGGNRTSKSISGALESSFHATGLYPDWWKGKRFDKPTHGWAIGSTARATRDTVQKEILGPVGSWGTGMIPADCIGKIWALAGVPQGVDVMQVKHVSGGWSTIGFKNYEQPIEAFYGTALHWVWGDEIMPINIYNECLVRTMTTRGIMYITFTPLTGLTPLVVKFCETADYLAGAKKILGLPTSDEGDESEGLLDTTAHKAIVQVGWDDAPWLDKEQTERILESSEPHLRETRRSGVPSMGSGAVYPLSLDQFVVDPFEIPEHFKRLYALDVGWNFTACIWLAIDPNSGIVYLYDEHYVEKQPPAVHAHSIRSRGEWIPGVIDPASKGRSQGDGSQLMQMYKDLGLKIVKANNDVEGGIQAVWSLLSSGKIRVFSHLHNFAKEYVLYRRDENGRIVKEKDHLCDAVRYGIVELHRAKSKNQLMRAPSYRGPTRYNV